MLDQRCDLDFEETSLQDVMDFLSEKFKINIEIDTRALQDIGVAADTSITIHVKDISLRSALRLMLNRHDLTWVIEDEVLKITTIDVATEKLLTRIYPVGEFVIVNKGLSGHPIVISDYGPFYANDVDFDQLTQLITASVAPDSWDEAGGPGTIGTFYNQRVCALVITQTEDVHEEITDLLDRLCKLPSYRKTDQASDPKKQEDKTSSVLHVYPINPRNNTSLKELAKLIQSVVMPESWNKEDASITIIAETMVVRHQAQVQKKVYQFLSNLEVLSP